ncbi:MAG TPA: heavy metal-binding domain-containing protein [Candidatus Omnitrophota bacterium]|nr:heavy metal-binding domain-containing protein [Candidatus Omnitrophota bacterium]
MSNTSKIIVSILILAALGGGWLLLQGHKAASSQAAAKEIWYCPMHPHYTSDRPGDCPICGMKLVKKEGHPNAEHALQEHIAGPENRLADHAPVALDARQEQLMGVKTVAVRKQALMKTIRVPGYVSTNHELFELQNEYVQAYINYITVYRDYRRFEHTRRNWETHRGLQVKIHEVEDKLLRLGFSSDQIGKLRNVSWKTLWDQPELLLFKEGAHYWVVAQIFEPDRGFVEAGQEAEVEIPAYAEKIKGVIRTVGGIFDPQTRTVNAIIELTGYRGELEGNMLVNVTIPVDLNEFLIVPSTAVMDTGLRKIVYVESKPGIFEPREIQTGPLGDNGWAVKSGLAQGEQVAVEGNFLLDSESRLRAVLSNDTAGQGEHAHGQ